MTKMKKKGTKLFIVALASFLMLVFCIVAASADSSLRFIDPTPANYTQEQDFTLSVLAINTHKSIYLPNEAASIAIAVLDNEGHMVCDADVTLTITDPSDNETVLSTGNGLINVSPQCCVYGVTNLPDYYTNYEVGGAGTYVMNLTVTAVTADGTKSITDVFTVQNSVDFDVARDGATRIYPPVPYVMNFTIKANKNYTGLIREKVPSSFAITPQSGLKVDTIGDTKILSWDVNLREGDTITLTYEFDAPDVSPEFYILGPLEIGSFKETRQWQIASDLITLDDLTITHQANCDPCEWDHTVTTGGSNRMLVVVVTLDGPEIIQGNVSYAGAALTKVRGDALTDKAASSIWYKTNPATGTNTISIAFDKSPGLFDAISYTLLGVDQGPSPVDVHNGATGTSILATVDLTTAVANTWVIDGTFSQVARTMIPHTGRTERLNVAAAKGGASSTLADAAIATHTMDWTISSSKQWAISAAAFKPVTWESYETVGHNTVWGTDLNPYDIDTHIVYMYGEGFIAGHSYTVGYYDGSGIYKQASETGTLVGTALSSKYDCTSYAAQHGTWHAVVFDDAGGSPPATYGECSGAQGYVVEDDFEVNPGAIPEFPDVIAAIAVCMLCAVAYMVMRRKVGKG